MHDVFISYSAKDRNAAYAVCHALESDLIRCWIAPRDIVPGDDWGRSIQEAISAGKGLVLILSKNSIASRQVQAEVILAVQENRFVVPIRIEEVSPVGALQLQLAGTHWLDAFPPPLDQHLKSLAETIRSLTSAWERDGASDAGPTATRTPLKDLKLTTQTGASAATFLGGKSLKGRLMVSAVTAACVIILITAIVFSFRKKESVQDAIAPPAVNNPATSSPATLRPIEVAAGQEDKAHTAISTPTTPNQVLAPAKRPHVAKAPVLATWAPALKSRLDGKVLFDPHLNASFVADGNMPATNSLGVAGIQAGGAMTWPVADAWIKALNACRYLGYSDWRLPIMIPLNEADIRFANPADPSTSYDGSSDIGFNVGAPGTLHFGKAKSELPHLFYVELGNHGEKDIHGVKRTVADFNSGQFTNLKQGYYWMDTPYGTGHFAFGFDSGAQYAFAPEWNYRVIAARTGDTHPIQQAEDERRQCRF